MGEHSRAQDSGSNVRRSLRQPDRKGRPLNLEENPYEDPSLRMAHRLLRNNGFAPAWVEEAKDLERAVDEARSELARGMDLERFRDRVAEINRRILSHNLKTPSAQFHLPIVDADLLMRKKR